MRVSLVLATVLTFGLSTTILRANGPAETVVESEMVISDLMAIPGKQIPKRLLDEAQAVAIIPNVIKIGFVAGARRGHGVVMVRDAEGEWSLPQFITLTGGSVGWQAGIQGTDVVLVFTTRRGVDGLMRGKFTVGADASVSAGPIGREAAIGTDPALRSEIYSYSRSRGLFVGVAIDGSALEVDHEAHQYFYGTPSGQVPRRVPSSADQLRHYLVDLTPHASKQLPSDQPIPTTTPRTMDALRRSLLNSSTQLQAILSPEWRPYLAMPREVIEPGAHPHHDSLNVTMQRFTRVNRSPEYQQLVARPEFQNTYELLREYEQALKSTRSMLQLPPPPDRTDE